MTNRTDFDRAWDRLPAALQAHPGIKDLQRAHLAALSAPAAVPAGWRIWSDRGWMHFTRPDGFTQAVTDHEPQHSHAETLHMLLDALTASVEKAAPEQGRALLDEFLAAAADAGITHLSAQQAAQPVADHSADASKMVPAGIEPGLTPDAQPVAPDKWEGAEEWMPLAWELCAEECGEEACTELVWEGGPIPEPWGDRWLKYEHEAKRLIALVRKCTAAAAPVAVVLTASACCPVCGVNHPHAHTPKQVAHWLQAQAARFHMGGAIEVMTRWEADDLRQYKEAVDENNRRHVVEAYVGASASQAPVGPAPLTDEQIEAFRTEALRFAMSRPVEGVPDGTRYAVAFARAIERAHGISASKGGDKP